MRSRLQREGSVGLMIIAGLVTILGAFLWIRNFQFGERNYRITVNFPEATGIIEGSTVLYRGVEVGRVTEIKAQANGVEAQLQISPTTLRMPPQLTIEPSRFGLIGEAVVNITPKQAVSEDIGSMTAVSDNCDSEIIVCNGDTLQGESQGELLANLSRMGELYSDPEFYEAMLNSLKNLSKAGDSIDSLTKDISRLTYTLETELRNFTANTDEITAEIVEVSQDIKVLSSELTSVSQEINGLITANRDNIQTTVNNINEASYELSQLLTETRPAIARINTILENNDPQPLLENLETLTAELTEFTNQLNSDTNILTIQQTLDSARATFANAEKITADIDQLTGDPEFRTNVRKLVNGLSDLISSTETLEQQVQTAAALNSVTKKVEQQLQVMESVAIKSSETDNTPQPNTAPLTESCMVKAAGEQGSKGAGEKAENPFFEVLFSLLPGCSFQNDRGMQSLPLHPGL